MSLISLILVIFISECSECDCKPVAANANERPHGANEFILIPDIKVKRIAGKVFRQLSDYPENEAIVEVFNYSSSSLDYKDVQNALVKKRRAACMTGENGVFCFNKLPPGRYLLRAGTRKFAAMNEIHAIVIVLPKNQKGSTEEIELTLKPGT